MILQTADILNTSISYLSYNHVSYLITLHYITWIRADFHVMWRRPLRDGGQVGDHCLEMVRQHLHVLKTLNHIWDHWSEVCVKCLEAWNHWLFWFFLLETTIQDGVIKCLSVMRCWGILQLCLCQHIRSFCLTGPWDFSSDNYVTFNKTWGHFSAVFLAQN